MKPPHAKTRATGSKAVEDSTVVTVPLVIYFEPIAAKWEEAGLWGTTLKKTADGKVEKKRHIAIKATAKPIAAVIPKEGDEIFAVEIATLPKPLDAHKTRTAFLGLQSDDQIMAFLNKTGLFCSRDIAWKFDDFHAWQRFFSEMMLLPLGKWRTMTGYEHYTILADEATRLVLNLRFKKAKPYGVVECEYTLQAIVASILLDHLRNATFVTCKECGRAFEKKHKNLFCCFYCNKRFHERARRKRIRELKAASKSETPDSL